MSGATTLPTTFDIRDHDGVLQAVHHRVEHPNGGKSVYWRGPNGEDGLDGRHTSTLPLWGSEHVRDWPTDEWIVITEGEKAAWALSALGMHALATFGAGAIPAVDTLLPIAPDRKFILWPDNDKAGQDHMRKVGPNLYRAGAVHVLKINIPTGWPKGADAWDFLGLRLAKDATPLMSDEVWVERQRDRVAAFLAKWARPVQPPKIEQARFFIHTEPTPIHRGGVTVEDLVMRTGAKRQPNGSWLAHCPAHEDRVSSLSFRTGDRQELILRCHAGCAFPDILKAIGA